MSCDAFVVLMCMDITCVRTFITLLNKIKFQKIFGLLFKITNLCFASEDYSPPLGGNIKKNKKVLGEDRINSKQ